MNTKPITVQDAVRVLGEAFAADPKAMEALVEARVSCNEALSGHPTIQVQVREDGSCEVGLLGILNGLFGINHDGRGHIEAVYDGVYPTLAGFRVGPAEGA